MPRNTSTSNSRNAILRGPILKLLKLSLHVSVKKSNFKFFFLHKTKYKHWALSIRPKRPKMWKRLQVVREFQGKVWELMNFQNPNYSTKNSRDSGRKFGYTSLGCPLFRKFGKCCGRKESGHWFFFSNQQSVQRMRNISEKWHTTTV